MFIRNAWYVAAWADEIVQRPLARRICNDPVVLYRGMDGTVAALEDRCCHRSVPLAHGQVVEKGIECGYHGLVYDGTGRCVHVPGQDLVPKRARVRSYPVVEKDAFIWIWMGDAAKADRSQIVDYPLHEDRVNWPHKHDMYPIKAGYTLMIDNLMDLTHLGYVHRQTIGGTPLAHVEAKMKTTRMPNGLKYTRWMLNHVPPPTYVAAVGFKGLVDRWQEFEFIAPGSIVQWTGAVDVGRGVYEGGSREGGFSLRIFHALTPETDGRCFYFWSSANGYRQHEPAATEQLFQAIASTFLEDKVIVEAQQARLEECGEAGLIDIDSDAARIHMRRVIERRLAEEASSVAAQ
jgi:phenylpropionate dioxygenase-like ring-hydroxylating dioxygenase large terminal subunit